MMKTAHWTLVSMSTTLTMIFFFIVALNPPGNFTYIILKAQTDPKQAADKAAIDLAEDEISEAKHTTESSKTINQKNASSNIIIPQVTVGHSQALCQAWIPPPSIPISNTASQAHCRVKHHHAS